MYELEIQEIVADIQSHKCALFVGAGLSIGAGLPSWMSLIESLLNDLKVQSNADFLTIAQAYAYIHGRDAIEKKVQSLISIPGRKPTNSHNLLSKLPVDIWITTNYDDLLERTLACPQQNVLIQDEDFVNTDAHKTIVVKLHGDLSQPHTLMLTKNDYFLCYRKNEIIWSYMRVLLAQRRFVFLGYSLRDPDFSQVQAQLVHHLGPNVMKTSYAVLFNVDEVWTSDLRSRNVEIIDLSKLGYNNQEQAMYRFLSILIERIRPFPSIDSEIHSGEEGEKLLPEYVRTKLLSLGCEFVCCIEYHTYCSYLDEGQFIPIPPGWTPSVPNEFQRLEFHLEPYERSDLNRKNIWVGIAVARIQKKRAA